MSDYLDILTKAKLRVTPVRERVLEQMSSLDFAVTHQEIELALSNVDRVTLYRTLKSFEQKGIIHKVVDGTGADKYALCEHKCDEHHHQDDHIHFNCDECGNTYCVDEVGIPTINLPSGYVVKSTNIIMKGTCENCD